MGERERGISFPTNMLLVGMPHTRMLLPCTYAYLGELRSRVVYTISFPFLSFPFLSCKLHASYTLRGGVGATPPFEFCKRQRRFQQSSSRITGRYFRNTRDSVLRRLWRFVPVELTRGPHVIFSEFCEALGKTSK